MKKFYKNNKQNLFITLGLLACTLGLPHISLAHTKAKNRKIPKNSISKELEWVISNDPDNICHGYFVQPVLDASGEPILPPKFSSTEIHADSGAFSQTSASKLSGDVTVLQPGRRLTANNAILYRTKGGKYKALFLSGDVRAYEPGQLFIAKTAYYNFLEKTSKLNDVKYRVVLASPNDAASHLSPLNKNQKKITGTVAWGQAQDVKQLKPKHSELTEATYTTCAPDAAVWKLISSKIRLNKETDVGTAQNVRLNVLDVPVLYWPYLNFPLSKKRKSGFLFPILGHNNKSGYIFGLPYYWNIAPNYDDTITPTVYSKRGVMFTNQFRYLTDRSYGEIIGSFLPNDREFKEFKSTAAQKYPGQYGLNDLLKSSKNRYSFIWRDNTAIDQNWTSNIDYAKVSDDYYFQDFGDIPESIAANQLLQQAQIQYHDEHWIFTGLVQSYQTLHPVNRQLVTNPYKRLPQLSLDGNFPDAWKGFNFTWKSQGTYFDSAPIPGVTPNINGGRFEVRPGISYPVNWIWGFFEPQIQYDATYYGLKNQIPNKPSNITRTLPIIDVHSGLYFDRDINLFNTTYEQTLEPELYYLYVPYRKQNNIPNFDSGIIPFTYSQLFANNRFSSIDRIADANQVSFALTTRIINNDTGDQKFRFSIGDIYYFKKPEVQLSNQPSYRDFDFLTGLGAAPIDEHFSPIAALATYNLNPVWSANGGYAWDPNKHQSITGSFYLSYTPAPNHILDFGYSYIRNGDIINNVPLGSYKNNLNQFNVDSAWPINSHWSVVGIFNYNISQKHPQTYMAGFEYNTCCIRARFVGGRTFSNVNQLGNYQMHNAFYFQLQLKGLGNIGNNSISNILTSNINGYVDPFQNNSFMNI